ncbi:MAG TPA: hypothetical protein VMO00_15815 [Methylomirabilota bacterium]|nr:hypothetical protein [Methylomirabilota bacterium]
MAIQPPLPPSMPARPSIEAIFCYSLVEKGSFLAQAKKLGAAVFDVKESSVEGPFFAISDDATQMFFGNSRAIFQQQRPSGLPNTPAAAEARARQFLNFANRAANDAGITAAMKAQMLFPDVQLIAASPMFHPETMELDHWLCSFQPKLTTGSSSEMAPVVDSTIDIRVGGSDRIVGLAAKWSPISQSAMCSPIAPPNVCDLSWSPEYQQRAGYAASGVSTVEPDICYCLAGEEGPSAKWLVPYFVFSEDPLLRRYPAAQQPIR